MTDEYDDEDENVKITFRLDPVILNGGIDSVQPFKEALGFIYQYKRDLQSLHKCNPVVARGNALLCGLARYMHDAATDARPEVMTLTKIENEQEENLPFPKDSPTKMSERELEAFKEILEINLTALKDNEETDNDAEAKLAWIADKFEEIGKTAEKNAQIFYNISVPFKVVYNRSDAAFNVTPAVRLKNMNKIIEHLDGLLNEYFRFQEASESFIGISDGDFDYTNWSSFWNTPHGIYPKSSNIFLLVPGNIAAVPKVFRYFGEFSTPDELEIIKEDSNPAAVEEKTREDVRATKALGGWTIIHDIIYENDPKQLKTLYLDIGIDHPIEVNSKTVENQGVLAGYELIHAFALLHTSEFTGEWEKMQQLRAFQETNVKSQ